MNLIETIPNTQDKSQKIRVEAYCRVATKEQLSSSKSNHQDYNEMNTNAVREKDSERSLNMEGI